ncbi:54S ribosomal protein L2 mitochondrial [Podochytrium sp. JEL0797]|nr:54S ribosomal protein L2 mitochondrial [Podochytrium sp. JEL0797]
MSLFRSTLLGINRPGTSATSMQSVLFAGQVRHATKKAGGSTSNGRSSQPKHLGVKAGNGAAVVPGTIIVRQRGTSWHAGPGVGLGKDHTLFALQNGRVVFRYDLARQRRVVAVSDESGLEAPLVGLGSRTETKRRLADKVDANKYLALDAAGRLAYVRALAVELDVEDKEAKQKQLAQRLAAPGRKAFNLVDLTML